MKNALFIAGLTCLFGLAGCSKTTDISESYTMTFGDSKAIMIEPASQDRTITASWNVEGGGGMHGYIVTATDEKSALKGMDESSSPDRKTIIKDTNDKLCSMKDKAKHEFTFTAKANQGYAFVLHRDINDNITHKGAPKDAKVKVEVKEVKAKSGG
jgi:hypothetical protein